ncbi:MAG: hypothetical protein HC842_05220 [Cytophagales bacterium]|nr:hypothetical protein [Cytophagales bacterium]
MSNESTLVVDVKITTAEKKTEQVQNLAPGDLTASRSYAAGITTFVISPEGKTSFTEEINGKTCEEYLLTILSEEEAKVEPQAVD